ncbi:hypothetical protein AB0B31_06080 [Catellatospora citrea]|uniref:hypothetical protein n=1 Tax=Catellatospora citrea TaxID=53366 RepID=UPI0034038013
MDPFAILQTGVGGGTWLAAGTNRDLTIHNRSGHAIFVALCSGGDSYSAGWAFIPDGGGRAVAIAATGSGEVCLFARTADGRWSFGGAEKFYVAQPWGDSVGQGSTFRIKNARTQRPSLLAGAGELRVVGGVAITMTRDTYFQVT